MLGDGMLGDGMLGDGMLGDGRHGAGATQGWLETSSMTATPVVETLDTVGLACNGTMWNA